MRLISSRQLGSSPRMRGARTDGQNDNREWGIIPADAGSTPFMNVNIHTNRDHPRGCGEHTWARRAESM